LVEELRTSEPYEEDNPPPDAGRGIYLFSEGHQNLYVGRTGITARSRAAGKDPKTSFLARWMQHTSERSTPNQAPFANKLAKELANEFGLERPADLKRSYNLARTEQWWTKLRMLDPPPDYFVAFQEAKRFIREDLQFRCRAFDEDERGVRSHVAEVYVDVILQTTYGDFSPS
jgi:hypothetical protein